MPDPVLSPGDTAAKKKKQTKIPVLIDQTF